MMMAMIVSHQAAHSLYHCARRVALPTFASHLLVIALAARLPFTPGGLFVALVGHHLLDARGPARRFATPTRISGRVGGCSFAHTTISSLVLRPHTAGAQADQEEQHGHTRGAAHHREQKLGSPRRGNAVGSE